MCRYGSLIKINPSVIDVLGLPTVTASRDYYCFLIYSVRSSNAIPKIHAKHTTCVTGGKAEWIIMASVLCKLLLLPYL